MNKHSERVCALITSATRLFPFKEKMLKKKTGQIGLQEQRTKQFVVIDCFAGIVDGITVGPPKHFFV